MIEYLFCALRNLGRKKFRTILTVSGIAIGVASVILIGAIGEGGKQAVATELDSLGINGLNIAPNSGSTSSKTQIGDDDVTACTKVNGVKSAMPVITQAGTTTVHESENNALFWGVGTNAGNIISLQLCNGHMFSTGDIKAHALVCLVEDKFAKEYFSRTNITGEKITVYMGNGYSQLVVKGVVASGSGMLSNLVSSYMPYFIYVPYTTAEDLRGETGYDEIAVQTVSNQNIDSIGAKIVSLLSARNGSTDTFVANNMFRQKERLSDLLNIVTLIISAVGAISLVVAGLGIMTVMTVSVSERTREIGIKKAIGAKKQVIMLEFLFEALAISLFGGMIGILAGAGLSGLAAAVLHFRFSLSARSILLSTGFAVLIGVLFGVNPAVKASRLKPVDALRQE